MGPSPRLLIIADIGGDDRRHIGDEAMLEANLATFRSLIPGVTFTVVSRHPAVTAKRYGVESVAAPPFTAEPQAGQERRAALDALLATAAAGGRSAFIDAVA